MVLKTTEERKHRLKSAAAIRKAAAGKDCMVVWGIMTNDVEDLLSDLEECKEKLLALGININ